MEKNNIRLQVSEEEKKILLKQAQAILMGTELLMEGPEIPLRDQKMIKKMREAGETLFSMVASDEQMKQTLLREQSENANTNQMMNIDEADQLVIYKSYINDVTRISQTLEHDFSENLDLYRIEVHGIKSMSRQLGYMQMGEAAEIMEMAAKAQHLPFIERNIKGFLADLRIVLMEATARHDELAERVGKISSDTGENEKSQKLSDDSYKTILPQLKEAFESFNLDQIEQSIEALSSYSLEGKEKEIYEAIRLSAENLEYEAGIEFTREWIQG